MLIFHLMNGLGNQMFILAFAEYMKKKYPEHEIRFDDTDIPEILNGRTMRSLSEIFEYKFQTVSDHEARKYCSKPLYSSIVSNFPILGKIEKKKNRYRKQNKTVHYIKEPEYWKIDDEFVGMIKAVDLSRDNKEVYYFEGFWENVKYLDEYQETIKEALAISIKSDEIINLGNKLSNSNSVAIHIRRGDFIQESSSKAFPKNDYSICDEQYYKEALRIITERTGKSELYFFTDDPQYVIDTYGRLDNFHIIESNKDYEDLYLMTCCKNLIIANSTFSFWGAWLNKHEGIVIAPHIHYIHMESEDSIYINLFFKMTNWLYIDNYNKQEGMLICH